MPISKIQIEVDDPTFQSWSRSMANLTRSFTVPITVVQPIPGVQIPTILPFTGVDLLNEIGRAATRPEVIDDPERLFALFRYSTKVAEQVPNFRLSSRRQIRDIHKSSVLSDEMGAGFAMLFASRLLGVSIFLDLHSAIERRLVKRLASKSKVPDYVGLYGPGSSTVILEAKGTQTKGRFLSTQHKKGCAQVAAVAVPTGRNAIRIVVGTEMHRDTQEEDTTLFVGDPEERHAYPFFEDRSIESIAVRDHYRRVAALIGDPALLRRTEQREAPTPSTSELETRRVGNRSVVGSMFEIRSQRGSAGFFVGIDTDTRAELLDAPSDDADVRVPFIPPGSGRHRDRESLSAYSIAPDGTVLEMWFQGAFVNEIEPEEV